MSRDDEFKDGLRSDDPLKPLNIKENKKNPIAVAVQSGATLENIPRIIASGRGKIAEQILQMAYENGMKVRSDEDLAEILAKIDLDSPIPSEAFLAIAEVLSYVFRANGEPDPFNAVLKDVLSNWQGQADNAIEDISGTDKKKKE